MVIDPIFKLGLGLFPVFGRFNVFLRALRQGSFYLGRFYLVTPAFGGGFHIWHTYSVAQNLIFLYIAFILLYTMIKNLSEKDKKGFAFIRNMIVHKGKSPTLREINEVTGGKSPRSASILVDRLVKIGLLRKEGRILRVVDMGVDQKSESIITVDVPLVGSVACGSPILAEENIETYIPVSTEFARKGSDYFLLRARGDSMDLADINDGNILLIRKQDTAVDGEMVVALIDEEATVKFFERTAHAVILRPKSTNQEHKPIILTNNCRIQGVVVSVLPSDLY